MSALRSRAEEETKEGKLGRKAPAGAKARRRQKGELGTQGGSYKFGQSAPAKGLIDNS